MCQTKVTNCWFKLKLHLFYYVLTFWMKSLAILPTVQRQQCYFKSSLQQCSYNKHNRAQTVRESICYQKNGITLIEKSSFRDKITVFVLVSVKSENKYPPNGLAEMNSPPERYCIFLKAWIRGKVNCKIADSVTLTFYFSFCLVLTVGCIIWRIILLAVHVTSKLQRFQA